MQAETQDTPGWVQFTEEGLVLRTGGRPLGARAMDLLSSAVLAGFWYLALLWVLCFGGAGPSRHGRHEFDLSGGGSLEMVAGFAGVLWLVSMGVALLVNLQPEDSPVRKRAAGVALFLPLMATGSLLNAVDYRPE